jgi:Aldo/keto reductase family
MLLHWPYSSVPLGEPIAGLNAAVKAGKVRHIGVSNFNRQLLAEAVRLSDAPIVTNQFEYHPYLNQRLLIDECRRLGISVTAYCGMAVGRVFDDPILLGIADRRAKTVARIVLRWLIQHDGVVALSRKPIQCGFQRTSTFSGSNLAPRKCGRSATWRLATAGSLARQNHLRRGTQPRSSSFRVISLEVDFNRAIDLLVEAKI